VIRPLSFYNASSVGKGGALDGAATAHQKCTGLRRRLELEAGGVLRFFGAPSSFNHFPKLGIFLQGFVLAGFQTGTEQKILERMTAENPVDEDAQLMPLKIDAVITDPETVQRAPALFEPAKFLKFRAAHLLGQAAKLAEDLQLQFLGHPGQFSGAGRREDDLKRLHGNSMS